MCVFFCFLYLLSKQENVFISLTLSFVKISHFYSCLSHYAHPPLPTCPDLTTRASETEDVFLLCFCYVMSRYMWCYKEYGSTDFISAFCNACELRIFFTWEDFNKSSYYNKSDQYVLKPELYLHLTVLCCSLWHSLTAIHSMGSLNFYQSNLKGFNGVHAR